MVTWPGNPRLFQAKIPTRSTAVAASSAAALNRKPRSMPATDTASMLVNTDISSDTRKNVGLLRQRVPSNLEQFQEKCVTVFLPELRKTRVRAFP